MQETGVRSLGQEAPLEEEITTHSSIFAQKIPWTEKPGEPPSMGSQRVVHDWATGHTHFQGPRQDTNSDVRWLPWWQWFHSRASEGGDMPLGSWPREGQSQGLADGTWRGPREECRPQAAWIVGPWERIMEGEFTFHLPFPYWFPRTEKQAGGCFPSPSPPKPTLR